jgi:ATP-binding protein involved in chromosome partitioning
LDLPPGTGDTQLTLAQSLQLSGAIIVTTPQDVSLKIARRGLRMFETVQVPIVGIVENMSTFTCPHCGGDSDVFGHGGGELMSADLGVPFLGAIPLDANIVLGGDSGTPVVVERPDSPAGITYQRIADNLHASLSGTDTAVLAPFIWNWDTGAAAPPWVEQACHPGANPLIPAGFARRDDRTLSVLWLDGVVNDLDVRDLRIMCRCAACVEEMSGRPLLNPDSIAADVSPRTITSVGNYAINIAWSDGHDTGIYSFEYLRSAAAGRPAGTVEDV